MAHNDILFLRIKNFISCFPKVGMEALIKMGSGAGGGGGGGGSGAAATAGGGGAAGEAAAEEKKKAEIWRSKCIPNESKWHFLNIF